VAAIRSLADLPDQGLRVVALEVLAADNLDAVEALGGVEGTVDEHLIQREVAAQLLLVDREFLLLQLGGPIGPIRARELGVFLTGSSSGDGLLVQQSLVLAVGVAHRGGDHLVQQPLDGLDGAGGFLLRYEVRVGAVAQQLGAAGAQAGDLLEGLVVSRAGTLQGGLVNPAANLRVVEGLQDGLHAGQAEPDEPALLAGLLRIGGQYLAGGLAEASELRFLSDQHGGGLGLLLQDAAEAGGQLGEALVDLLELIPLLRGELRPSPAELAAPVGHERGLLAALLDLGPLVDPLDALPQRFVEVELGEV